MPILGLTTESEESNPVYEMLGMADVKCYKGARKTGTGEFTRPGKDLEDKIRVTTTHRSAIGVLKDTYGEPNKEGDFIVEQVNLYIALEDIDLTFETQMKAFDGSGTLTVCDRHTIYKEAQTVTTHKGKRRMLKSCDKPCPLRGEDSWDCPNECKPDGILHFFIRELLDSDLMIHCQFEMKAYGDVGNIIKQLRRIKQELGSLTRSPYPCYWTRHRIPLVLTRIERDRNRPATALKPESDWKRPGKKEYEFTGKKGLAKFWDLDIQVDPVWMDWYRKQQLTEELTKRGLNPSREAIVALMTGDAIDVKAIASSATLPTLPPVAEATPQNTAVTVVAPESSFMPTSPQNRTATPNMVMQLEAAFTENGWTEDAIALLLEHYQIDDLNEITQEQRLELELIAGNPHVRRDWNDAATQPPTTITESDWSEIIYPEFVKQQWSSKRAIMTMLQNEYGITRVGELLKSQIDEVLELAKSSEVRSRYLP